MDETAAAAAPTPVVMAGVELSGQIHGDASTLFETLNQRRPGCAGARLRQAHVRIDFTAAGNLLNWVIEQKARGVRVSQTHRLVAALFDALGISEQARVVRKTEVFFMLLSAPQAQLILLDWQSQSLATLADAPALLTRARAACKSWRKFLPATRPRSRNCLWRWLAIGRLKLNKTRPNTSSAAAIARPMRFAPSIAT